jgi:hypothetical protein
MPNYRVLRHYEIDEREDLIAEIVAEIANFSLRIRLPNRSFIEETAGVGDIKSTESIRGLYQLHRIFIHRSLPDHTLVDTVAHELRHAWQNQKQTYRWLPECERDANLFAQEFKIAIGPPPASKIIERLITVRSMRGRELSAYVKHVLLNRRGDCSEIYGHQ